MHKTGNISVIIVCFCFVFIGIVFSVSDPYAVPIPVTPSGIDNAGLPPPPPEFGLEFASGPGTEGNISFNINDLPPPIPDSPAPNYLTSQTSPNQQQQRANHPVHHQQQQQYHQPVTLPSPHLSVPPPAANSQPSSTPATAAPWEQGSRSPRSNSRGEMPPPTLAKKGKKLDTNFLAQLNSTLGGSQAVPAAPENKQSAPPSAAVQNLKTSRNSESPPREHLLSEIHGGIKLKKAANVNDRSAPSVR